jgi:hypothetical protein
MVTGKRDVSKTVILPSGTCAEAGRVTPEERPEGLLCKPCPICGYKYGTAWNNERVPKDVLKWLYNMPETKIAPAWV